jgi:LmbE family N-acetylglucosaminyl deacetylase
LVETHPDLEITWIVFSSDKVRAKETASSFKKFLAPLRRKSLEINEFRNGYFPFDGGEIKDYFEDLKNRVQPDVIFSHYRDDLHQDHRVISELTWNTFRNNWILEFEIPKFDGGIGSPNLFVPTDVGHAEKKSDFLLTCYKTQSKRPWFSRSTFDALMRLRGIECNSESGYAEAFYARKTVLS